MAFLTDYVRLLRNETGPVENDEIEIFAELQSPLDRGRCLMLAGSLASKARLFSLASTSFASARLQLDSGSVVLSELGLCINLIEQHELDAAESCLKGTEHETIGPLLGIIARMRDQPKVPATASDKESVTIVAQQQRSFKLVNQLDAIKLNLYGELAQMASTEIDAIKSAALHKLDAINKMLNQ